MGIEFYIADIETTGLSVDKHEINQISILRVSTKKQLTINIRVKNPQIYDKRALDIQGIEPEDLKHGVYIADAVNQINDFIKEDGNKKAGRCFIAHNASFDRKFIIRAYDELDQVFPADLWLCSQSFSKRYVKKHAVEVKIAQAQKDSGEDIKTDKSGRLKPKFGLTNMLIGLKLPQKLGAHQAAIDVQNTDTLFEFLINSGTEYLSLIENLPHKEEKIEIDLDIDDF